MLDIYIKRTTGDNPLWEALEKHYHKIQEWEIPKTVCVVKGFTGSGKTRYLLEYFKNRSFFYFSFAGLTESLAEKLFAEQVSMKTGVSVIGWAEAFTALARRYRMILLDDLSSLSSYKRFHNRVFHIDSGKP